MLVTKCIVCGNVIDPPRRGKKYCSDACKSRAYFDRKKREEIIKEPEESTPVYTFDYAEYKKVKEIGCNEIFEVYCFLRKNLSGETNIQEIRDYLKEFDTTDLYDVSSISVLFKEYQKFLIVFHSGKVKITNTYGSGK